MFVDVRLVGFHPPKIVALTEPLLDKPKKLLAANTLPYLPVISATTKY